MPKRMTEEEWLDLQSLRKHYNTWCDCDPFEGADTFQERMEARGYIKMRRATRADLEDPFAYERGIEPGGNVWDLTAKGRKALAIK